MKRNTDKSNSVMSGLFWTFGERIIAQLVTTIVTIVLARLIDPEHYGIISIVTIFITFFNIFVSAGFGSAVVQKKDANDDDFNTAFFISFTMSLILYAVLFIIAPYISIFYATPQLTAVIRVMGIRLIVASLNTIQHAYIQKQMKFKKFFFATLVGTIVSAIIGILLAYKGFEVWALVTQYMTNTIIDTIVLYFVSGWKIRFKYNKTSAKKLFSFGWKVLVTELVYTIEGDIRSLIVGKMFGPSDLAYYDQGKKYPSLLVNNINSSINKVMLPAYSRNQDNIDLLKTMLRKSIKIGIYLLAPILIGFAVVSRDFVSLLLTDKWIEAVPYIQIFCIVYLTRPLESTCHQVLLSIGESGLVMKIIIGINVFALLTVFIAVFYFKSVLIIAFGSLISTMVSIFLFMSMTSKKIDYKPKEQFVDIRGPLLSSFVMGICIYFISYIKINIILKLIMQCITGAIIYLLLSTVLKLDGYIYLKTKVMLYLKKKQNM